MDKMTVDSAPASGSANLVTSGGVFTAINAKQNTLPATGSSTQPIYVSAAGTVTACSLGAAATKGVSTSVTSGDSNLVTGDAVFQAINNQIGTIESALNTLNSGAGI